MLFRFSGREGTWGPSTGGLTASGNEAQVPGEGLSPQLPASLWMSKNSLEGSGGGAGGGFPVLAVRGTRLGAGARVPAASEGVSMAESRATREEFSDAARQMLLDKQGTYKLLILLYPEASWRELELIFLLGTNLVAA